VQAAVAAFGGVDILVNCAHNLRDLQKPFLEVTDEDIYRQFDSGLMGTIYFMRACFPYFKNKGGKIINIASGQGIRGGAEFLGYNLTKEAIRATTRTAAREWGALGINVNTICPLAESPTMKAWSSQPELGSAVVSSTRPIPRLGRCEEDVGRVAVFLASSDADYMTGSTLMVDGGGSMDAGR
jgi:NAD(P)-dependent dehydrogenase (short-subunit alcohol dehydrogenase family)